MQKVLQADMNNNSLEKSDSLNWGALVLRFEKYIRIFFFYCKPAEGNTPSSHTVILNNTAMLNIECCHFVKVKFKFGTPMNFINLQHKSNISMDCNIECWTKFITPTPLWPSKKSRREFERLHELSVGLSQFTTV